MKIQDRDRRLFGFGAVIGFVALSIALAAVPREGMIDEAAPQQLSEIRVSREAPPNFDSDIQKLSAIESRYHDRSELSRSARAKARIHKALDRVSHEDYRYSGK